MAKVSDNNGSRFGLTRLAPHLMGMNVPPDAIQKLYFSSTSSSSYRAIKGCSSSSFSDVHKAAQRIPRSKALKAPFWSREMTRYQQAFIPLPLDGAVINRELAKTFNPNDADSPAATRSVSVPTFNRTRYEEDFPGIDLVPGNHRPPSMKPKIETHVRDDAKLLYTQSVTHEAYQKPQMPATKKHVGSILEAASSPRLGFRGRTRYSEEFVSKEGYRVEVVKGRDDGNRINGNSIPTKLKEYMHDHDLANLNGIDIDAILRSKEGRKPFDTNSVYYSNPYLSEYMS